MDIHLSLNSALLKRVLFELFQFIFFGFKRKKTFRIVRMKGRSSSRLRNPQFVIYLESTRFFYRNLDRYERKLRRKALWKRGSLTLGALLFGWLILESAQAFTLF